MDSITVGGSQYSQFPPGFRFHPTDQELIFHYLRNKVTSAPSPVTCIIADVDIYKFNPWELPDKACFGEGEWFFFSPRDRKYPNGSRPNRAAGSGYWKATGTDKPILATGGSQCLGVKKALVFYQGRPPKGTKTDWVMHEYRLLDNKSSSWPHKPNSMRLDDWVLCRVRHKGSTPNEIEEKQETSSSANPLGSLISNEHDNLVSVEHEVLRERVKSINEWSDRQLLAYLLGSQDEGGESTSEVLYSTKSSSQDSITSCGYAADFTQSPPLVSSVLDSIKRTLSFGALDELMLQLPNKRLHHANISEQSSPASSFSVHQLYQEFRI